jgi:hypothetical protein
MYTPANSDRALSPKRARKFILVATADASIAMLRVFPGVPPL